LRTRRYSERLLRVVTREVEPLACVALAMRHPSLPRPSSREALATLRASPCHYPPTTRGRHALAETMPALAHELARLVGPFHVKSPFRVKAPTGVKPFASKSVWLKLVRFRLVRFRLVRFRLVRSKSLLKLRLLKPRLLKPRLLKPHVLKSHTPQGEGSRWENALLTAASPPGDMQAKSRSRCKSPRL
jgi:hypothetical protein